MTARKPPEANSRNTNWIGQRLTFEKEKIVFTQNSKMSKI